MKLFKITKDEITETKSISPEDIALVLNEEIKTLYVYKGEKSTVYNELKSDALYERITNQFFNPKIFLIKSPGCKKTRSSGYSSSKEFCIEPFSQHEEILRNILSKKYIFTTSNPQK